QEPRRVLRVPALPDGAPERRLLPRAHAGQEAPDEPRAARGARAEGGQGRHRPGDGPAGGRLGRRLLRRPAAEPRQDWPPRLQDHQDPRPHDPPAGPAVPAAVPGHCARRRAPLAGHERLHPARRGPGPQLSVPPRRRRAVRDVRLQDSRARARQARRQAVLLLGSRLQGVLGSGHVHVRARGALCCRAGSE
ncbi:hypothetical protein BN1708_018807, partial [Verticillium longisporum]